MIKAISIYCCIKINCYNFFFQTGLLDTITSTVDSKDCPGVCVHTLATLICYDVLENVQCPQSMKCCIEPPPVNTTEKRQPNTTLTITTQPSTYKPTTTPLITEITTTKPLSTTTIKVNNVYFFFF